MKFLLKTRKPLSFLISCFVLFGLLLGSSCDKDDIPKDQIPPVLFQYEYINYAWGFAHKGWFVNQDGKVYSFNLPDDWNDVDKNMLLTENELEGNFHQADLIEVVTEKKTVENFWEMIPDLRMSRLIESNEHMADAGTASFYAWIPKGERKYERVLIASSGDISQWSAYPETEKITDWLKQIGREVGDFFWPEGN